ncbi:MAG: SulP family inorganic anion transporter [Actinomycetota bacterium]|nr:SulP family inorganic anion transporter [Actinomycetota bacterium]
MAAGETDTASLERRPEPPKDWLPGLVQNYRSDVVSGLVIFLIALPLCLAIAGASGVPPIAGIIAGIVAGTLANLLSGSYVTINGPAAGMIVIVAGAVAELGYGQALAVGVVAGGIQIVLCLLKAGKLTGFFPLSVVHGMLAGIGLIIMSGQIHIALGRPNPREHGFHILTAIPPSFAELVPETALVGLAAVVVMVVWPRLGPAAKMVPAPLVAVVVGTAIALVNDAKPTLDLEGGLIEGITAPDFSAILSGPSLKWIALYVFVASLESLLTAEAVDKLDPYKRRSNMNRELLGKGVGNMVSSSLGGLPMIAEVVRSKANIMAGARTRWSNFFHGVFLGLFVLAAPGLLELIPVAALAGVLLVIGFKLAHPNDFRHALLVGKVDFVLMLVTAFTVLFTDLLIGVTTGIVLGLIVALVRGTSLGNLFKARMTVIEEGDAIRIVLRGALGFHNFVKLRSTLDGLPPGKTVILDFTEVRYVDPTVMERLSDFQLAYTQDGGTVVRVGYEPLRPAGLHEFSARTRAKAA